MCRRFTLATLAACFALSAYAQSEEIHGTELNISSYTCRQFLNDVEHPNEPQKLVRALMLVSWAAGFAASRERSGPRADNSTLSVVSASLKLMCQLKPKEFAINVFVKRSSIYPKRR